MFGGSYDNELSVVEERWTVEAFKDFGLDAPDIYLDAVLILGDTNSCLSAISAKRLHIPNFYMEAGNRCKDEGKPYEGY